MLGIERVLAAIIIIIIVIIIRGEKDTIHNVPCESLE